MSSQNILFFGASRGCGFYALLSLLRSGGRATLLLRKPDTVTSNPEFQALTSEQKGRANLIKGDAFVREDVQRVVDAAGEGMDTVVFSIGIMPSSIPKMTWSRGVIMDPPQPCARSITNLLSILQDMNRPGLRLLIVSSMGMGDKHKALEYISLLCSKHRTPALPEARTLPSSISSLRQDWLDEVVVLRPALLTDGKEAPPGKVRAGVSVKGAYTISRRDVGKFIVDECLKGNDKWVGEKGVVIAY